MASAGGLQRRRVGGGGGSASGSPATTPSATRTTDPMANLASAPAGSSSSAGAGPSTGANGSSANGPSSGNLSRSESGHKIAYDPRDLDDRGEDKLNPKLSLMEEILLLGLKDKQGYLSFWNDNISYTLRGCILLELALRHRIAMVKDPNRRRFPLPDRYIEVIDERLTGEVLLDEALKMMKVSERMSVGTWIDLMSGSCRFPCPNGPASLKVLAGETWNVMKIGYQLKQVRERLAKGLVDKGVLRTEKRNFLLFDMATHPVSDASFKEDVLRRTLSLLSARTAAVPTTDLYSEDVRYRTIRAVAMVCAAFAANVLENALVHLSYDSRELAMQKCDELLAEFSQWPFATPRGGSGVGVGSGGSDATSANLAEISRLARSELSANNELQMEIVAAVLHVFGKMYAFSIFACLRTR